MNLRSIAVVQATLTPLLSRHFMLPVHALGPPAAAPGLAARWDRPLSADPVTGSLFLCGGNSSTGPRADFWVLDELGERP